VGSPLDALDFAAAARRLEGVVRETPLVPWAAGDPRVELRLKLECQQEAGAFKARGAWNQISQLTDEERARGVVATSSGNHAKALAWAARRAGVRCTVFMPADAYANKVQACRDAGAEVVITPTRQEAEARCREAVAQGAVLVHPYDALRTIEGAGTVGLELARQWPEVEVVVTPLGGGGLTSGIALALADHPARVVAVEPAGAPKMTRALAAGAPVVLERIESQVQGLIPLAVGALNLEACRRAVDRVLTLDDATIFAAQRDLVRDAGLVVEPAGAAAVALVRASRLPADWLAGRTAADPLRVVAVVSGGNPDPTQLEAIRG
jgi:threonine dehydratase